MDKIMQMDKEPNQNSYCNNCAKTTTWTKNKSYLICQECKGVFPCKKACTHWDCRLERKEIEECSGCGLLKEIGGACMCKETLTQDNVENLPERDLTDSRGASRERCSRIAPFEKKTKSFLHIQKQPANVKI